MQEDDLSLAFALYEIGTKPIRLIAIGVDSSNGFDKLFVVVFHDEIVYSCLDHHGFLKPIHSQQVCSLAKMKHTNLHVNLP